MSSLLAVGMKEARLSSFFFCSAFRHRNVWRFLALRASYRIEELVDEKFVKTSLRELNATLRKELDRFICEIF